MKKTDYFLRKKSKNIDIINNAKNLKKNIKNILNEIYKLGYDKETIKEIESILKRKNGHEIFLSESEENENILLVRYYPNWKPIFNLGNGYSNLSDMEKWYKELKETHEIVKKEEKSQKVISWEEFIKSVQSLKWSKFGLPKKYNKHEETIWEYLSI